MKEDNSLILSIETAIGGGSISLFKGAIELTTLEGEKEISRAEDLLANITEILKMNSLNLKDLDRIAVSVGPGSYTGIRVGIATVLGLKKALNSDCVGVDTLEALALPAAQQATRVISAVPLGRSDVCWRIAEDGQSGQVFVDKKESFIEIINSREDAVSVVHEILYYHLGVNAINGGSGMSRHIARAVAAGKYRPSLEPLYVRG